MNDCCRSRNRVAWFFLVALALVFTMSGVAPALADDCEPSPEVCNGVDDDCDGTVDDVVDPDPVDGLDNNGNGLVDEGHGSCIFAQSGPANECKTAGRLVCEGGALVCAQRAPEVLTYSEETLVTGNNCSDSDDNDCDGLTDIHDPGCQSAEVCDGLDNDGDGNVDDGFSVGAPCSAGTGECQRNGVRICAADHLSSVCSVTAGSPKNEGAQFGNTCGNGVDDNCNNLTDLADPVCAGFGQAELCGNNVDDDGDGQTDEGFATLGLPCSVGSGACAANGVFVCTADGTGTECGATPNPSTVENEASGTCADFLDNDCDGFTDKTDVDCGSAYADLGVTCSLPYTNGRPGADCNAKNVITIDAGQATTIKADLLALDPAGNLLGIIENVQNGEQAQLASRNQLQVDTLRNRYKIHAPIPLLRVVGKKGNVEDVAYCSILPYLEVTRPNGETISLSEGKDLDVNAFLPLVNVDTLKIRLNGLNLLSAIGIDPATAFPTAGGALCTAPGSCVFQIAAGCGDGGLVNVEIKNLRVDGLDTSLAVDAREGVEAPHQANVVSFTVSGLPAGGHMFNITGDPLPLPKRLSAQCNVDDLADSGRVSAFGITVDSPTDQQVVASAPVTVAGTVCSGNPIAGLRINGRDVDVTAPAHQTCTTGDGVLTSDECVVNFSEAMPEKNLADAILGNAENASYKRGSNRVVADATDNQANRTFNTNVIFGLGAVQEQDSAMALLKALPGNANLDGIVMDVMDAFTTDINPAFVVGLDEEAVQKFFNAKCQGAIDQFTTRATASLQGKDFATVDIDPDCSCAVSAKIVLETLTFTPTTANPACKVDFKAGEIDVKVNLPDIFLQVGAHDSCTDHGLFGECIARTKVNVTAQSNIKNISFAFTINETQIETKTPPDKTGFVFAWSLRDSADRPAFNQVGHCQGGPLDGRECYGNKKDVLPLTSPMCEGAPCVDVVKNPDFKPVTHQDVGIECWGASICLAFEAIAAAFITVFTFGLVDGFDLIGFLDFDVDFNEDFLAELKGSEPDAMALDEVEVDEEAVSQAGHSSFTPGPIDVEIEDGGLTVAFGAEFTVQSTDPNIPTTPPPPATPARVPTVAEVTQVGDDITMLVADDVFGQVFAAMRSAGLLQAVCTNLDGKTVNDLLPKPEDGGCDSLGPDNAVGAALQGVCHAIRGADCLTLTSDTNLKTNAKIGACVGFSGGVCADLPIGPRVTCAITPSRNIRSTDGLLICARQDMEPDLLIKDDNLADATVQTDLILEDINVMFALDRGGDGYTGRLEDLPGCFGEAGDASPDCRIVAACADLTLKTAMGIDSATCKPNQAGFVFSLLEVIPSSLNLGVLCSGTAGGDDTSVLNQALDSVVIDTVSDRAEAFTPPICVDGLDLNGVLNFNSGDAKLFGLTTNGGTGFADFLGITVGLNP